MCGISGVIGDASADARAAVGRMNRALAHRGPDGEGLTSGTSYVFGHRRLAIVDLSEQGAQPMVYGGRYTITYNGEIYNYLELRKELTAAGYRFESKTDTEVLMAAYDRWGVECLGRLNGMWAFVLHDAQTGRFFISRDRFGVKPLYYFRSNGRFVFASEIKALLHHPLAPRQPNMGYCREYLARGAREYLQETAFEDIFRIRNASWLLGTAEEFGSGRAKEQVFWTLAPNLENEPFQDSRCSSIASEYYELLKDAVGLRLRSDVKVGSALSGGLDSSSVVALINANLRDQGLQEKQETFSCVYKSEGTEDCDESGYIDLLVKALGVRSNQIEPRVEDVPAEHEKMVFFMDTPPDNTAMSGWHTFKQVSRSDVIVTLDGQGADEQMGGYLSYLASYLGGCSNALTEYGSLRALPGARRFADAGLTLWAARRVLGGKVAGWLWERAGGPRSALEPLNEVLANDSQMGLVTLIHYSDRVSMAHSRESRMPFLDFRLAEFLASVPAAYKIRRGWTKYIARLAFEGILPAAVTWRRDKMGWPIPEEWWFRGPLRGWFCGRIETSRILREMGVGERIREEVERGVPMRELVRLLNLAVWADIFFERQGLSSITA